MRSKREYKSGSRWALWRWTFTPSNYITRLHLLKTPWFAVCLHWINGPDEEPYYHDHPVSFLSLILRGWYYEFRELRWQDCSGKRRWWNFIRASKADRHIIAVVPPGGALTLCFMGPKTREWGFHLGEEWVPWRTYNDRKYKGVQS